MDQIELNKFTRFHVETVKGADTNAAELGFSQTEDKPDNAICCTKNLKYMITREALPRLDNYRHIMSIQAAYRPTLDDLHDAVTAKSPNDSDEHRRDYDNKTAQGKSLEFGWIKGVLLPNFLSMCSVIFFFRFGWIIVQTGLVQGLLLVAFVGIVNLITALSISAISTNGIIKEGGSYMMMSRCLGPEFGVPVGIVLLVSNIGLCAMYCIGLMEYFISRTGLCWFDCGIQDVRNFSILIFVFSIMVAIVCVMYDSRRFSCVRIQMILFAIMAAAVIDFLAAPIIGVTYGPLKDSFSHFRWSVLVDNLFAKYPDEKNEEYNLFFSLFAIFYPSLSEFLTGVTMSGNLKDPLKSIPKGTVLSVISSLIFYFFISIVIAGTVLHTGVVAVTLNNDTVLEICHNQSCNSKTYDLYYLVEEMCPERYLVRTATVLGSVYCIMSNCLTAVSSFKVLCNDNALYPNSFKWFANANAPKTSTTVNAQAYLFAIIIGFPFLLQGKMNTVAQLVSILLLAAYALINFSTFHISLVGSVGWRPTFKIHNMWVSLFASLVCLGIMFLINWISALITVIIILALYLAVSYENPNMNWGSSTQAQTYHNALLSVQSLSHVEDHVKNYHPQVLVLSGFPSDRPSLITFTNLITKNISLMICGHIHSGNVSHREQQEFLVKTQNWLDFNRAKAFYTQVDDFSFDNGAKALMQATGLGKLKPNILLMGYKNNWTRCSQSDLNSYFSVIHKALDSYLSLCILRVDKGLDFSSLVIDHEQVEETVSRNTNPPPPYIRDKNNRSKLECKRVTFLKNEAGILTNDASKSDNLPEEISLVKDDISVGDIYRSKDGLMLPDELRSRITQFQGKQKKGTIDVWWLYDDGGLTLLLPYIISTRRNWSACKLRVFALASNYDPLDFEQRNMASLLSKFRIDYSDLTVFSDLVKKPQEETIAFYENLIKNFKTSSSGDDGNGTPNDGVVITDSDLASMEEKTNRHLRLRELLLEHSQDASLIVMTLPIPRKSVVSAALYMSWLEALTQGMPPFLLVRGNQTSVLTFYS